MNYLVPIPVSGALNTDTVYPDTTKPTLEYFALDMDSANLTLTFSETVNASSLSPNNIMFSNTNSSYALTGGFVIDIYDTEVIMNLNDADFDRIKSMPTLCASSATSDCLLNIESDAILDMSMNGNLPETLEPTKVTTDTTEPYLVYFDLDLNLEELHLTFSEVIVTSGQNTIQGITLLATPFEFDALSNDSRGIYIDESDAESYAGVLQAYTFSGGYLSGPNTIPDHPPVLIVSLNNKDLNLLKSLEFVATEFDNTFLLIAPESATDYRGNYIMKQNLGMQVRVYTPDQQRPSLTEFELDMDLGVLTITFSETVNRSSLQTSMISFQGSNDSTQSDLYSLNGGISTSYNNPIIKIMLSESDVNEIKARTLIATDNTTTYISLQETAIADQDGNLVLPIPSENGTLTSSYIPDTTNPQLLQFSLDLNTGYFHLTFDETVNVSSFNVETIIVSENTTSAGANISLEVGTLLSTDSTILSYRLSEDDLNYIKLEDLCTVEMDGSDCYLWIFNDTIQDMNSNPVVGAALNVNPYIADTTEPEIIYFAVNMSLGNVTLGFSEVVDISSFNPTHLVLHEFQEREHATIFYNLTGGTRVTQENGLFIDFYFNSADLEFLRRNEEIFISQVTSYISAGAETVRDMSNNPLMPLEFKIADNYARDTIGPRVTGASLNLTGGTLQLTFSETVRASSFRPTEITLLNQANVTLNNTVSFKLSGGTFGTEPEFDSTIITVLLTPDDVQEILSRETLATSADDSYLSYTLLVATDLAENPAEVSEIIQITDYFGDTLDPQLFSFIRLDLSDRLMILEFDEPVDISTINISLFFLQQPQNNILGETVPIQLTGGVFSYLEPDDNQKRVIILHFNEQDYRSIVLDEFFGKSEGTTHISLPLGAVFDFAGNPLVDIPQDRGVRVLELIEDLTNPQLLEYDLDLDTGLLTLEFDNVMNNDTLNPSAITIQNNKTSTSAYNLIGGTTNSDSNYTIVLQLADVDLNSIKRNIAIATSRDNTYITFSADFIDSHGGEIDPIALVAAGVDVLSITDGNAKMVRLYTPDTNNPSLVSFNLDLSTNELTLTFNETVDASELDLTTITLQDGAKNASVQLSLTLRTLVTPTISSQEDSTVIVVSLGFDDRNDIRRLTGLAVSNDTTYISITNETIVDMSGYPVIGISSDEALSVSNFTQDTVSPLLERFSLDVNRGVLKLTFDETVNASSLRTDTILLQNDENELIANESVFLTESSFTDSDNSYIIVINISTSDLNLIKQHQYLAQSNLDTFLVISAETVQDMNGNSAEPISPRLAERVDMYIADSSPPVFQSFHLDMDNGVLCLTFDETIDVSTFQYTQITFSSDNLTHFEEMYTLTADQEPPLEDSHDPCIQLSLSDQYMLKLLTFLATSINDTFIDFDYGLVQDMALMPVASEITLLPLQAENYTEDTTPPELLQFRANLNSSTISLLFDEPVNVSSFVYDRFTILNSNSIDAAKYNLADGYTTSENGIYVVVTITENDLNEIKKIENLFTGEEDTYLQYASDTVRDMAGNPIVGISASETRPAVDFISDTTRPMLTAFDLDMTDEVLTLYFSETVNYMTLNLTSVSLQQNESVAGMNLSVRLTSGVVNMVDDTLIRIQLVKEDIDLLKIYKIAVSNSSVWLTIDEGGILDQSGERLLARENGRSAIQVSDYRRDEQPPILESFVLDLDQGGLLWLTFSETVDASTFNSTSVTLLHSSPGDLSPDTSLPLSPFSSNWEWDHPVQRVSFSASDLNELKRLRYLATNENNTYISIDEGGIDDVFGNPVIEINVTQPRLALDVIPDTTFPELLFYNLNLTSETLLLSFTETVNASSLSVAGITLFGESLINENTSTFQLTQDSEIKGGNADDKDSTSITVKIGTNDLNKIKQFTQLAVSNETTYLTLLSSTIADMSSNPLVPVTTADPRDVAVFYDDFIQPMLLSFGLDVDSGVLSLTFDETVNSSSIAPNQVTLLGESSNATEHMLTLTGANYISPIYDTLILINLTDQDLNEIKRQRGLATNSSSLYISITEELVVDMNGNPVLFIDGLNVTDYVNDTTSPILLGFDLDLTSNTLTLTFSETVWVSTLNFNSITIQNERNNQQHQLMSGEILTLYDDTIVVIELNNTDLNEIKKMENLATHNNNTYISINMYLIQDMNTNYNRPIYPEQPLQVTNFTADLVRPHLVDFLLDMDGIGLLQLTFSETVNVSSLEVSAITLHEDRGVVEGSHTLELSYVNSTNSPIVNIVIGREDLNILKMLRQLAISRLSTFISITDELVLDMNDNNNTVIAIDEAVEANDFVADQTPPELESFSIDMDSGLLTLNFSETVIGINLQRSYFTIQNDSNLSTSYVSLMEVSNLNLGLVTSLLLELTDIELNELKRITDLATGVPDTWLSVDEGGIEDVFNNKLVEIEADRALQASSHTPDTTDPTLVDFDIDLDAGELTLIFDETVDASSLNVTQVQLQDTVFGGTNNTYILTGGHWEMTDSTIIILTFSFTDLNAIKKIRDLASCDPFTFSSGSSFSETTLSGSGSGSGSGEEVMNCNNTFIVISNTTIVDMNSNPIQPILTSQAKPVRRITLDTTQPQLVSFDFNLDTEQLILTFDETVDTLTLMLNQFTILGDPATENYTLTGGFTPSEDDYIIVVQLDISDVNNIKKNFAVAFSQSSTNLLLSSNAILDMNANMLNFTDQTMVRSYQNDTRPPVLLNFNLDLNSSELVLTFNETIWVDTLEVTEITIQDSAELNDSDPTSFRTLQAGVTLTTDDTVLVISLQPVDTNYIKTYINLATSQNNTYISLSNLTITDTNSNPVTAILPNNAVQVLNFTADETSPMLVQFELDLTNEEIRLVFDETVNASSLDPTRITLYNAEDGGTDYYMLAAGSVRPLADHTNITLHLTREDLNEIKRNDNLSTSVNNTYISFDEFFLVDMNNNSIVPISHPNLTQAADFFEDTVEPELEFFHLNLTQGVLYLTFSETVRSLTLQPSSFAFQSQNDSANISYVLTGGIILSPNSPEVTLELTVYDLNNIKRIRQLATTENNTYITVNSSGITDMNNNSIKPITEDDALGAELVSPDQLMPTLQFFSLDLDSDILWLTFDETMLVSELNATHITVVNAESIENISSMYYLQSSGLLPGRSDDPVVPVLLSRLDSNEIKKLTDLATNENDTFITLQSETITDMNYNPVVRVTPARQVTNFTEDTTQPELEMLWVDMDARTLFLYFSETVNVSTLSVSDITLQDAEAAQGPSVTLSEPTAAVGIYEPVVPVILSESDANTLTSLINLYNNENDSFISITNLTVWDMNDNNVVPVADGNATMATEYIDDITNVTLVNFTVNLDNWTLTLSFDETVSSSTFDYTRIHLYSDSAGTINLTLTNGSFDLPYTHLVTLTLTASDICRIKVTEDLWTTLNDTWLYIEQGGVHDWTEMNPLNEVLIQAEYHPIERDLPNLVAFAFNVTDGVLILNFDEPVRPMTLQYKHFLFQNESDNYTESHRLSGGYTSSPNGKQVIVMLTSRDLNIIKSLTSLFTSPNSSFLTLNEGAIRDMAYNPSSAVEGFPIDMFFNDTGEPALVNFAIDMNAGELTFTFSETVDVSSIDMTQIRLQSDSNVLEPIEFHYFTDGTIAFTSDMDRMLDNRIVLVNISLTDLNEIKRKGIAYSIDTAWLVIHEGALTDNNLQPIVPLVNGINAKRAGNYTNDTTSPELLYYDLSMDSGILTLYFSETVDATTLDVSEITLQSSANISIAVNMFRLVNSSFFPANPLSIDDYPTDISGSGSGSGSGSFNDSGAGSTFMTWASGDFGSGASSDPPSSFTSDIFTLYLSHYDSNSIKALTELAVDDDSTYISMTVSALQDTVGNMLSEVRSSAARMVREYKKDDTRPELRRFDLDLDSGNLTLTFTETVNVSSLDVTQLTLINERSENSASPYSLQYFPPYPNTSASFSDDWPVVVIQIGHEDLDAIKNIRDLATGNDNTLLIFTDTAIWDNAGNAVVARAHHEAQRVNQYTPDTTRPELYSYDVDLDDGRLILTFTETVKIIDSLNVTQITLQNTPEQNENDTQSFYSLTNDLSHPSSSMDMDSRVVFIRIGFTDLNAIKYRSGLALDNSTTFISITNLTVVDLSDNAVVAEESEFGQRVRILTPDQSGPVLLSYSLNMTSTTLILTFNETVNASSLDVSEIAIQHSPTSSSYYHSSPLILTPGWNETFTDSDNGHLLVVHLGPTDRNELKRRRNLAISNDTTYLVATSNSLADMGGNDLVPIKDGSAKQVDVYVPDNLPPVVTSFTIDMDLGALQITFDETVRADRLVLTGLTLQDNTTAAGLNFTLRGGVPPASDSTVLKVYFTFRDFNEIKRLTLCRERDVCYLSHREAVVVDMVNIPIEGRPDGEALQVTAVTPDIIRPEIIVFSVNLTSEIFSMIFSETVNASSLNFTAITLQDFFEASTSYTLTDGLLLSNDSTVIEFQMALEDLNEIKRNTDLFTIRSNSWITFTQYAIHDMALIPNRVVPVVDSPDVVDGRAVLELTPDLIEPELWYFDLNLTSHELILYFSETVEARTLNINEITLQNSQVRYDTSEFVTLTMGSLPLHTQSFTDDYHVLVIHLGEVDTNRIKAFTNLATHENNTYISLTANTVHDMNSNPIVEIPLYDGKRVRVLYDDFVRPELREFSLDIDAGELHLTFSETINASSLRVEEIVLQNTRYGLGTSWRLTAEEVVEMFVMMSGSGTVSGSASSSSGSGLQSGSGLDYGSGYGSDLLDKTMVSVNDTGIPDPFEPYHSLTLSADGPVITISLGFTDRNAIKGILDLGTSVDDTYISMSPDAFSDMNGNLVVQIPDYDALNASEVVPDETSPTLVLFSFNLTSEILSLTFDETVDASSLNPSAISIQAAEFTPVVSFILWHQLVGGIWSENDSHIIGIELNTTDLNEIKQLTGIATTSDNTFIVFSSNLVRDTSGNAVNSITNGQGLQVNLFVGDRVRPVLDNFSLDMNRGLLHLTFSETVNASTLAVSELTLQDDRSNLMNRTITLSPPSRDLLDENDVVITIELGRRDLNYIKSTEMFGLSRADTWLRLTENLVQDMSGNPIVAVVDGNARRVSDFIPDTTRPVLLAYHFDFIQETILLIFNEPMNMSLINYTLITIQDGLNADDQYSLTNGTAEPYELNTDILLFFDEADIAYLKLHPSLATSGNDSYLSFDSNAFFDTATIPNPVQPHIDRVNATGVTNFTYYEAPEFMTLIPIAGRKSGGTLITITGANFGSLSNESDARDIDVYIGDMLATNITVTMEGTTLQTLSSPLTQPELLGTPLNVTITIDSSTLSITIPAAYTYLDSPIITNVFPSAGTFMGDTLVLLSGENFGPPSAVGPLVRVYIGDSTCFNVSVENTSSLSCRSPPLPPGQYNVTVVVDGIHYTISNAFSSLELPVLQSISLPSAYRHTPTQVNITGENFGPPTGAWPLLVILESKFNISECTNPIILIEDTLLTCTMQPNLGPSNVTVVVDGVSSTPENNESALFFHFDDAGNFSFEFSEFFVSETEMFANVTVVRHDFPEFASPASVTMWAFGNTAVEGGHFLPSNSTQNMPYLTNKLIFQVTITAESYLPDNLRRGATDDVAVSLQITEVLPLHGHANISGQESSLIIRAVCQVITHECVAAWDLLRVVYYRLDELP